MSAERHVLRIAAVDDEAPARELLREYLSEMPDCELIATCADGFEAVRVVHELSPDLLLLDIQMPKLDGFDVIDLLDSPPAIIFVTAFEEHAVRAFEVAAVDYLLKPFAADRLRQAIDRARERILRGESQEIRSVVRELRPKGTPERILVREGQRIHVLAADDLDYAESQDDYVRLHAGGLELRKKQTLTALCEQLEGGRFVRVHRCFVVNLDRLARVEPYSRESRVAILDDGTRIPVSRAGYRRLKESL